MMSVSVALPALLVAASTLPAVSGEQAVAAGRRFLVQTGVHSSPRLMGLDLQGAPGSPGNVAWNLTFDAGGAPRTVRLSRADGTLLAMWTGAGNAGATACRLGLRLLTDRALVARCMAIANMAGLSHLKLAPPRHATVQQGDHNETAVWFDIVQNGRRVLRNLAPHGIGFSFSSRGGRLLEVVVAKPSQLLDGAPKQVTAARAARIVRASFTRLVSAAQPSKPLSVLESLGVPEAIYATDGKSALRPGWLFSAIVYQPPSRVGTKKAPQWTVVDAVDGRVLVPLHVIPESRIRQLGQWMSR